MASIPAESPPCGAYAPERTAVDGSRIACTMATQHGGEYHKDERFGLCWLRK